MSTITIGAGTMNRSPIICAALLGAAGLLTAPVYAQETKQETKSTAGQAMIAPVTQQQLNAAGKSARIFC